ncbi:hypothetical protein BGX29_000659 [Mortierella sp. GBA35]|nr:hypothetical protein BGX29_000659 [Mortierella sp. GBA35]
MPDLPPRRRHGCPARLNLLPLPRPRRLKSAEKRGLVTSPDVADAILVTVAIPRNRYWLLDDLLSNRSSALYVQESNSFGQFLDSKFALSNHPPSRNPFGNGDKDDGDVAADPLSGNNPTLVPGPDGAGSPNASHSPIIGSIVALATIAYVGIAIVVVRRVRAKRLRQQQEREAFQQTIAGPMHVHGGANGWGWHGD